ncbi:unnamed protein product [Moneuplotes crassus]|uniref:Uncharacterized protein n=1 Tax=Euplotes crassus TaxID=5936 RepID=A0AAD1XC59_EUPCR|nr:unnamed protein product [Moneuplotes crassus]
MNPYRNRKGNNPQVPPGDGTKTRKVTVAPISRGTIPSSLVYQSQLPPVTQHYTEIKSNLALMTQKNSLQETDYSRESSLDPISLKLKSDLKYTTTVKFMPLKPKSMRIPRNPDPKMLAFLAKNSLETCPSNYPFSGPQSPCPESQSLSRRARIVRHKNVTVNHRLKQLHRLKKSMKQKTTNLKELFIRKINLESDCEVSQYDSFRRVYPQNKCKNPSLGTQNFDIQAIEQKNDNDRIFSFNFTKGSSPIFINNSPVLEDIAKQGRAKSKKKTRNQRQSLVPQKLKDCYLKTHARVQKNSNYGFVESQERCTLSTTLNQLVPESSARHHMFPKKLQKYLKNAQKNPNFTPAPNNPQNNTLNSFGALCVDMRGSMSNQTPRNRCKKSKSRYQKPKNSPSKHKISLKLNSPSSITSLASFKN